MFKFKHKIFIISGPSGVGKTTLIKYLLKDKKISKILHKLKTYTTRVPRGKKELEDYYFIDKKEFEKLKKEGKLLEYQKIYGDWYGTPLKDVKESLKVSKHLLLCIDVKGALKIKRLFEKEVVLIFIAPPGLKELRKRILKRGKINKKELEERMRRVKEELQKSLRFDYIVVNRNLKETVFRIKNIILSLV